ncbi:MAG: RnfABCDGE type electron transport complex subunit B [Treponema sp.]|nr:RnfABCDGE type electron transport complex subunit B [Treponema sp.]
MSIVLLTALVALAIAFTLGLALGFFKHIFAVVEDPLVGQIKDLLPGVNCGGCGYPGCDGFAAALAAGDAPVNACPPGGADLVKQLAALVGGDADSTPLVAVLACAGTHNKAPLKGQYIGVNTCRAAKLSTGSIKRCTWACQSLGDCINVCKFDAMVMGDDGLPRIDAEKCTGCKACAKECPMSVILMVPKDFQGVRPLCSNLNVNKAMVSKNCKAGCFKCEICVKNCPETCIKMTKDLYIHSIPAIDNSKCTRCGVCVEKCPVKVLELV